MRLGVQDAVTSVRGGRIVKPSKLTCAARPPCAARYERWQTARRSARRVGRSHARTLRAREIARRKSPRASRGRRRLDKGAGMVVGARSPRKNHDAFLPHFHRLRLGHHLPWPAGAWRHRAELSEVRALQVGRKRREVSPAAIIAGFSVCAVARTSSPSPARPHRVRSRRFPSSSRHPARAGAHVVWRPPTPCLSCLALSSPSTPVSSSSAASTSDSLRR